MYELVLQRKPFAFELYFCWANAGFITFTTTRFSSKTAKSTSTCTTNQRWHTL